MTVPARLVRHLSQGNRIAVTSIGIWLLLKPGAIMPNLPGFVM